MKRTKKKKQYFIAQNKKINPSKAWEIKEKSKNKQKISLRKERGKTSKKHWQKDKKRQTYKN